MTKSEHLKRLAIKATLVAKTPAEVHMAAILIAMFVDRKHDDPAMHHQVWRTE